MVPQLTTLNIIKIVVLRPNKIDTHLAVLLNFVPSLRSRMIVTAIEILANLEHVLSERMALRASFGKVSSPQCG